MTHEKYLTLETGRTVKLILKSDLAPEKTGPEIDLDVLIKDPKDDHFHPPIEITHPKYWKLKTMEPVKSRDMQLRYSGIRDKQIRKAVKEFKEMLS